MRNLLPLVAWIPLVGAVFLVQGADLWLRLIALLLFALGGVALVLSVRARREQRQGLAWLDRFAEDIATVYGAGFIPKGSGTLGAWSALPFALALSFLPCWRRAVITAAITLLGTLATRRYLRTHQQAKDPSEVVIDEFAGMLVSLLFVPWSWRAAALGFLLFRMLDIVKPWPIRSLEHLPGAVGVMADDIAAGILAAVVLWGVVSLRIL